MYKSQEELICTLRHSVESAINMFKLIKANPPQLKAKSINQYAKLIDELLQEFTNLIPKMCVPKTLFLKMEQQSLQISDLAENYMKEHRKCLIEIKVLEDRIRAYEQRESQLLKDNQQFQKEIKIIKKQATLLKKSGEQGVKSMLNIQSQRDSRSHRHSLPHLQRKEKLSLLYLMGPSNHNQRLVHHLMNKR